MGWAAELGWLMYANRKARVAMMLSSFVVGIAYGQPAFNPDPSAVHPGTYELDPAHSRITWTTSHTAGLSHYSGLFIQLDGRLTIDPKQPETAALQVAVSMDKGGTFDSALDERLHKDFFDVAKHSTAKFVSTRIERRGERQALVTGDLTLKGVTKQITFTGTFNTAGIHPVNKRYTIGFDGETTIRRSDFGITAFPSIGNEVHLAIEVEFRIVD
jgi:polyisoprenoid-binding protein YceI